MNLVIFHCSFLSICVMCYAQNVTIANTILNYFNSDRSFREIWRKQKTGYETAFSKMLQENYGRSGMNVYAKKKSDTHMITEGFYISDNILDILIKDLYVVQLPILTANKVNIDLDSNVARFTGVLDKIIARAKYMLFRNHTAVVFSRSDQNLHKTSPFSLQQVQKTGELSIIADGCQLSGLAISKLSGMSVNLGHNTFILHNCELNIEVWTPGLGSPPIIAPYFSKKQGVQVFRLLSKPMRDELVSKLQAAMYSYINTSAIFGKDLLMFRFHQSKLFHDTSAYLRKVVTNYNKQAMAKGKDTFTIADKRIAWTEKIESRSHSFEITISNVRLHGLDTAYLSHNGGPYRHKKIKIEDELRFNNLQVRGQIIVQNNTEKVQRNFGAELRDVAVTIVVDVKAKQLSLQRFEMTGWRTMELNHFEIDSVLSRSFIIGYLTNEIPTVVNKQVKEMFGEALKQIGKKSSDRNSQNDQYLNSKTIESTKEAISNNVINNDEQSSDVNNKFGSDNSEENVEGENNNNADDNDVLNVKIKMNKCHSEKDNSPSIDDSAVNSAGEKKSYENREDIFSVGALSTDSKNGDVSSENVNNNVIKSHLDEDNSENDDNSKNSDEAVSSPEEENLNMNEDVKNINVLNMNTASSKEDNSDNNSNEIVNTSEENHSVKGDTVDTDQSSPLNGSDNDEQPDDDDHVSGGDNNAGESGVIATNKRKHL